MQHFDVARLSPNSVRNAVCHALNEPVYQYLRTRNLRYSTVYIDNSLRTLARDSLLLEHNEVFREKREIYYLLANTKKKKLAESWKILVSQSRTHGDSKAFWHKKFVTYLAGKLLFHLLNLRKLDFLDREVEGSMLLRTAENYLNFETVSHLRRRVSS